MKSSPKIYLAPFQGITGAVYHEIFARHFTGIDKFFTPFFTGVSRQKALKANITELVNTNSNAIPVVPQILSKDDREIIEFATHCTKKGFRGINWNLGCPFPRVASKQRGSGLLAHPRLVEQILGNVMPAISLKFSVKCRLGYHHPEEILKLVPVFNHYNISELIIHARTGKQLYKGDVLPDNFERAMNITNIPVVYNGDIFSVHDFLNASHRYPKINTWMIGRGILVDPLLPAHIKGIPICSEKKLPVRKFIDDLYFAYRKKMNDRLQAISIMKELWEYMAFSFANPHQVFKLVKRTTSFDDYEDAVSKIFHDFEWLGSESRQFSSGSI